MGGGWLSVSSSSSSSPLKLHPTLIGFLILHITTEQCKAHHVGMKQVLIIGKENPGRVLMGAIHVRALAESSCQHGCIVPNQGEAAGQNLTVTGWGMCVMDWTGVNAAVTMDFVHQLFLLLVAELK